MRPLAKLAVLTLPSVALTLGAAEVVLRTVLPAAELPLVAWDARYAILRHDVTNGPRTGVYTVGPTTRPRARWRLNDEGWNSDVEYPARRTPGRERVVIVGDSFVEALQVDVDRNLGAVLRQRMGGAEVFTVGLSGAPLSQYLQMARYAGRALHPDVLVINVVANDFDASLRTLAPTPQFMQFEPVGDDVREVAATPYVSGRVRRLLRRSALVRYVFQNCGGAKLPARLATLLRRAEPPPTRATANVDPGKLRRNAPVIIRTVDAIVRTMRAEHPGTRIVFVMDGLRADIYAGTLATSSIGWLGPMLRRAAEAHGCEFLDLTPTFARDWAAHHELLSFRDDFHWNERAHRLAADALLATLRAPHG